MKLMKKMMALVIAMVMVLAMALPAMAYTITISNETEGFTYLGYQIFTGDLSEGILSNVKWGTGITDAGKAALYTRYSLTGENQTASKVAEAIAAVGTSDADKKAEADAVATLLAKTTTGALDTSIAVPYNTDAKKYQTAELDSGWYLVVNTAVPSGYDITFSDYIVQVVDNVTVAPKSDKPSSEKKVQDINDSDATPTLSALQDSADYDIGDSIPYTLTATLPADYANYEAYYLEFQDDMSAGLTYNSDAKIYFGDGDTTGTSITFSEITDPASQYTNGNVYSYYIADLKADAYKNYNLGAGSVITIKYTATLNGSAVIGEVGNPNEYRIVYSNNPNNAGQGKPTGTTPWDINIVFTYKTVFNKVDGEGAALTGADFKLEKKVNGEWVDVTVLHDGENAANPTKTGDTNGSTFTFAGLDDGDYRLTETTTPAGYNTIDPIEFTITADHSIQSDNPALKDLTGTDGHEFVMTKNVPAGQLSQNITNLSGSTLPSTGGIGTTIFYVIGGILVVLAAVVLVTRRKAAK